MAWRRSSRLISFTATLGQGLGWAQTAVPPGQGLLVEVEQGPPTYHR